MSRFIRFILVVSLLMVSSMIFAQDNSIESELNKLRGRKIPKALLNEISVHIDNTPFKIALADISAKGGLNLSYNHELLPMEQKVSVHMDNVYAIEALLSVLQQTSTILEITNSGALAIMPAPKANRPFQTNTFKGQIKGVVMDSTNGEPLPGANVFIKGTSIGAATNLKGEFVLPKIPPGNYTLVITYIGFKTRQFEIRVEPGKVVNLEAKLTWIAVKGKTVEITAQASGQVKAINQQLAAAEIKNVVSSDRIQELPDANAAESVGRLPGVSILRSGGEGNKVVIRGLSPKYNKIMIEGIEMASTDAGDRSTNISMISPYSLEGIEVMKAATADQDADYIGGSVNFKIKSAEPGLKYDVIAQGSYNHLRNSYNDYLYTGSISNRFFNNKLGIFAQANIERRNRGSNQMGASYYMLTHDLDRINPTKLENLFLINTFRDRRRYGGSLTIDYILPQGVINLKNFISNGKTDVNSYYEGYDVRNRGHYYSTTTQENDLLVMSNILNYEQRYANLKFNATLAHSFSQNKTPEDISFGFAEPIPAIPGGMTDLPPDSIPYYAFNNIEAAYWDGVGDNYSITKERQFIAKADLEMNISLTSQINGKLKIGGKYRTKDRSFDFEATGGTLALNSGKVVKNAVLNAFPWMQETTPLGSPRLPYSLFINENFNHGEFLKGAYRLGPVADVDLMRKVIKVMRNVETPAIDTYSKMKMSSITSDYFGNEYLGAGYIMADLNITPRVKFIPGLRYEHNKTEYNGIRGRSDSGFPEQNYVHTDTTTQRINEYWLPMIHLQLKPLNWMQLRFAYTKTLSRPDFNLIIPRLDIGQETIVLNNYRLRPEQSENFDVYLSILNNYVGLFTLGGFRKNIKDMIFWLDRRVMLDPAEYRLSEREQGKFIVTQQNVDQMATVQGIELDWQTNFWYLPSVLKGLVFNLNYTHIFSEAKYPRTVIETEYNYTEPPYGLVMHNIDTTYTQRLLFQPDNIVNLAIGYDYKDFSCRLSMLYQTNIFMGPDFYPELRSSTGDYVRWDFSLKQNLPWAGLQLYLNINNITGATDLELNNVTKLPTSEEHYGRTIDFGLRWRLK